MTRPSRRELERAIDRLEDGGVATASAHTLVVPDSAIPETDRPPEPDVPTDVVTVPDEETGRSRYVVPLHAEGTRTDGIPMTTEHELRRLWGNLDEEQRQREKKLRSKHDLAVPPILEGVKA